MYNMQYWNGNLHTCYVQNFHLNITVYLPSRLKYKKSITSLEILTAPQRRPVGDLVLLKLAHAMLHCPPILWYTLLYICLKLIRKYNSCIHTMLYNYQNCNVYYCFQQFNKPKLYISLNILALKKCKIENMQTLKVQNWTKRLKLTTCLSEVCWELVWRRFTIKIQIQIQIQNKYKYKYKLNKKLTTCLSEVCWELVWLRFTS